MSSLSRGQASSSRTEGLSPKVAIVGSGPAGRSAARELIKAGVAVTIIEKEAEAGGLMRYGFPDFRMPTAISRRDAEELYRLGVELQFNCELGKDATLTQLCTGYDAVLLAMGSTVPRRLAVPGEDLPGVYDALTFLYASRTGQPIDPKRDVLVVGGGDTSIDAATTALELGAVSTTVLYRGSKSGLRALPHEIEFARKQGVQWRFEQFVTAIAAQPEPPGSRLRVSLRHAGTGAVSEEVCDLTIVAIGQEPNRKLFDRLGITPGSDGSTDQPNIWLAGDLMYGSDRLAKAILDGRRIAKKILTFLNAQP